MSTGTYQQTLDYLFKHLPMFQRIGAAAYKKDLTNTLHLCRVLNEPQEQFICIHVAGTNGKGSVSNMLASVLMEAGYKTGLYTSPHLLDFRERIRVNGEMCSETFVIDFTERIKPEIEAIQPSFFEITVAMAFEYFAQSGVQVAVIETGLGGRLDSTNVIYPILSVITNISFDHMALLGNTLEEIAVEKAGIIKNNVPVVIGEYQSETYPIFLEKAEREHAELFLASENIQVDVNEHNDARLDMHISILEKLVYPNLQIDLTGDYQVKNVKTAIQAVEVLRSGSLELTDEAIYEGLRKVTVNTGFQGRWQVLSHAPDIICDCAHNEGGLRSTFEQIRSRTYAQLHIITGFVHDKDLRLALVHYPIAAHYYFCRPDIPRGLDAETLAAAAENYQLHGLAYRSVAVAVQTATDKANKDDLILICGSIFVVAEALQYLKGSESNYTEHE